MTHPLKTPKTRLSMKKEPMTISGMKKTQLNAKPMASLVEYKIGVQPSIDTHWNTVNMARPMLSKDVMP